jgi:2'-5' RNA ligase superfamily
MSGGHQGLGEIRYAQDTSAWEDWQLEYRYGAFYLFPPSGVIERVDDLRKTYDPASAAVCQAHVSLSEPIPRPLEEGDLRELLVALSRVEPFTMTYREVHATPPYPGVVYTIGPASNFMALRSAVHSTSLFESSPLRRQELPPHMTIAEFITMERSVELAAQLMGNVPTGEWACRQIEYAVPDETMHFQRVLSLPLGAPPRFEGD